MRTTLDLDPEVVDAARKLAAAESQSLGEAISALARLGLETRLARGYTTRSGLPVFKVGKRAKPISLDDVKRDEDLAT